MHLPQIIYVAFVGFGLGISAVKHGEPKTGKYNFTSDAIATAAVIGILYWGGFFGH